MEGSCSLLGGGSAPLDILSDEDHDISRDPFDLEEFIDGFNVSASAGAVFGASAIVGIDKGESWNLATPSPKGVLQDLYEKECK